MKKTREHLLTHSAIALLSVTFLNLQVIASDNIPSQTHIIKKMADFLASVPDADAGQLKVIQNLQQSKGECAGLSSLWLLSKRISDDENPNQAPRDDIAFFKNVVHLLMTKVHKSGEHTTIDSMTPLEKADIQRFISHVLYFQKSAHDFTSNNTMNIEKDGVNVNLEKAYAYLTGKKLVEMLALTPLFCNTEILKDRLKKMIRPKVMISLGTQPVSSNQSGGHATAIYQSQPGEITYYDPNNGETVYTYNTDAEYDDVMNKITVKVWSSTELEPSNPMAGITTESMLYRALPIFVYRLERDTNISDYTQDLRLSFDEKEQLMSQANNNRVSNTFIENLNNAGVQTIDLQKELERQYDIAANKENFVEWLGGKVIGLELGGEKKLPFLKSIQKVETLPLMMAMLHIMTKKARGFRVYWFNALMTVSDDHLTYRLNEEDMMTAAAKIMSEALPRAGHITRHIRPFDMRDIINPNTDKNQRRSTEEDNEYPQRNLGEKYIKNIDVNSISSSAIGFALRSNYSKLMQYLLNDIGYFRCDSDSTGYFMQQSIKEMENAIFDFSDALTVLLSPGINKLSQPGLFWIAASIKEVLRQKAQLPTRLAARNQTDLNLKLEQLNRMEYVLNDALERRLLAGETFTETETELLRPLSFIHIESHSKQVS